MHDFDVIVVGGGPAGSTAAYFLGLNGVNTLLIDKGRFPRDKACGGGISTRVLSRFPHLARPLNSIPVNWIHHVHVESPKGAKARYSTQTPLYLMVRRYEFDNLLLSLARQTVAVSEETLITGIEVTSSGVAVQTKKGEVYTCEMIIGADGANSIVARVSGLASEDKAKTCAIDMMEETPYTTLDVADRNTMYIYYGIGGHQGYGYIFPKASHLNLGVGYKLDYYQSKFNRDHYGNYLTVLDRFKKEEIVDGRSIKENFLAFPLPVAGPLRRTYSDRIVLCGDAGGFVNGFTAEGIYYAMVSGEHAAASAIRARRDGDYSGPRLSLYEEMWQREIGFDLSKSVTIQRTLLADPSRIDRIVRAAGRDQKIAALLAGYATGAIDYRQFMRSFAKRAFPLYVREKARRILMGRQYDWDTNRK